MKKENSFFEFINDTIEFFALIGKTLRGKNKLSPEQIVLIDADVVVVNDRCQKVADANNDNEEKQQKNSDEICPNCKATKSDIVNKIREVHGSGEGHVEGNLFGVYGSSSMSIGTDGVNHCNKCGNEWKKFKKRFHSIREIIQDNTHYTARFIQDPVKNKWAKSFAKIFEGCYVETILRFAKENHSGLWSNDEEILCFNTLNKYFKSVWDNPNVKKELIDIF